MTAATSAPVKFKLGPLGFAISAAEWEAWLKGAPAGAVLPYARGLVLPAGSATVIAAREAAAAGLVALTQRRMDGEPGKREFEWIATRSSFSGLSRSQASAAGSSLVAGVAASGLTAVPPPPSSTVPLPVNGEDREAPEDAVLRLFRRAAGFRQVAPTNAEIAKALGLKDDEAARYLVGKLVKRGSIRIENVGPRDRRIVHICGTRLRTVGGKL